MHKGMKILIAFNLLAAVSSLALASKFFLAPWVAMQFYGEEYKVLMFSCDNAMREHLIAKNAVVAKTDESSVAMLRASELGLISCHDYDRLRKKMLVWGLTEYDLQQLGLEAIEESAEDVRRFVEIHEFRY